MRRIALLTCAAVILCMQFAQAQAPAAPPRRRAAAPTDAPARLPVRRVVLYKNGIGYFEHLGRVRGDDTISVDFNRLARVKQISDDQQRVRENLQTLNDTAEQRSLVRRFAGQLSQQEDQIQALRGELADLDRRRQQSDSELQLLIERLALDLAIEE